MELVFEVLGRGHRQSTIHKTYSTEVLLGRGWSNDIVLQDPLVESSHAKIVADPESDGYIVEDLGSVNGTWIAEGKRRRVEGKTYIKSGDTLIVGRSRLKVFDLEHPVDETHSPTRSELLASRAGQLSIAIPVALAALLVIPWLSYLDSYSPFHAQNAITDAVTIGIVGVAWATVWTFIGKFAKHEMHFGTHITLIFAFLASMSLLEHFNEILTFNHLSLRGHQIGNALLTLTAASLLLNATLFSSVPLKKSFRQIGSVGITSLIVTVFVVMPIFDDSTGQGRGDIARAPEIITLTRPDLFRVRAEVSINEFMADSSELFEQVSLEALADEES